MTSVELRFVMMTEVATGVCAFPRCKITHFAAIRQVLPEDFYLSPVIVFMTCPHRFHYLPFPFFLLAHFVFALFCRPVCGAKPYLFSTFVIGKMGRNIKSIDDF